MNEFATNALTQRAGLSKLRLFTHKDVSADQQLSSDKDITSSGDRERRGRAYSRQERQEIQGSQTRVQIPSRSSVM